ncbi:MAG: sigma-70 family RNA polymerase sigma factor [Clostridiales bacterium]|nr:sigma-70 family RNA polymerase sigma factor [Clostridiales bacterium]
MSISKQLLDGINTLRAGNSQGFDIVYGETSSYVFARARMIMNDEQDANDLVQDTYIQAYQNINSLQDPHNIFAWLGGIAYRQGMKIYRKKNDILLGDDNDGFFEQIENEDIEWNPELSMEQKAVGNIVAEIIDELPPLQKAALTAFYYD